MTRDQLADLLLYNPEIACDFLLENGCEELVKRLIPSFRRRAISDAYWSNNKYWSNFFRRGSKFCDYFKAEEIIDYIPSDPWYEASKLIDQLEKMENKSV